MNKAPADVIAEDISYRNKIMACTVIAELLILGVFTLWPMPESDATYQDIVFSDENVLVEETLITRQQSSPPPPPKPQVPVPVPNDEVIEEEIITLEDIDLSEYSDSMQVQGLGKLGDSRQVVSNPQTPPSVVRIVEPTIPQAARKADIKAEILVSFLVDKSGNVEEATIAQIKMYEKGGGSDRFELVKSIGYGLTEATLEAALQWKFRPAKHKGNPVRAYTRHYFSIGF